MKILIVGGPEQGKSFDLAPGNNFIGRADGNAVVLPSGQVSRRHACISLMEGRAFVEDLGSSNGTLVNGQRISGKVELIPGTVFQVGDFALQLGDGKPMPATGMPAAPRGPMPPLPPPGSARPAMPPMPVMMGASKAVESPFWKIYRPFHFLGWRGQVALLTISMILVILGGGVYPLLLANKRAMTDEVLKRAEVLVNKLAMRNGEFIRTRQETNLDTASFLSEPGVVGAYLLSKELMILSPVEQRGKSKINDVSKGALRQGSVTMEAPQVESDGEAGTYHLAVPIRVWNGDTGNYENYGVAYLVFQARLVAEAGADVQSKFVVAAITISLVVLIFIALIALVTLQPLKALHEDAELVMRGDLGKIESRARWRELVALSTTLNRSFERYAQERLNHASSAVEPIVPAFVPAPSGGVMAVAGAEDARVEAISNAVAEGVLITDDMQRVVFMNRIAERLFGVPLSRVKNRHVMDVISNQEILGAVLDLFKQVINTEEKTVSTTVSVAEADGTRKLNVVMAGVKGASRQLEYAAIVIRR